MAGWLDDYLNATASRPESRGLLDMLGQMLAAPPGTTSPVQLPGLPASMGQYGFPSPLDEEQRAAQDAAEAAARRQTKGVLERRGRPEEPLPPSPFDAAQAAGPALYGNIPKTYGDPTDAFAMPKLSAIPPQAAVAEMPTEPGATPVKTVPPEMISAPMTGDKSAPTVYFPPGAPASADLPTASAPTGGLAAPATQPAEHPLLGIGRGILQRLADNSAGLIAGGGAMMSGGLGKGFSAMAAAQPLDIAARKEREGNQAIAATYDAVLRQQLGRGIPMADARATALAASQNKEVLKEVLGPQYQHVMVKNDWGGETPMSYNQRTGEFIPANIQGAGAGAGMNNIDSSKTGDEYLSQFPKEAQAVILDYYNNRLTGGQPKGPVTPRLKMAAEKYAQDMGAPIDDISVAERKKLMLDIVDNKFSSIGGSKTNANASLKHLADSSDHAVRMNTQGNVLGSPDIAHGYNIVRNRIGDKSAIAGALYSSNYTYGGEKTKFLTGAQGAEKERLQYTKLMGPEKTPLELADVYAAERKELFDKLVSNQDKIERNIPASERAKHPEKYAMFEPETVAAIKRLDHNIATLRGEAGASGASAAPAAPRVPTEGDIIAGPKGRKQLRDNKWVDIP